MTVIHVRVWLCVATKIISIETDAYDLLAQEKKHRTESFSRVIRRLFAERPVLKAGKLLDVMQEFKGKGAGPRAQVAPSRLRHSDARTRFTVARLTPMRSASDAYETEKTSSQADLFG